MDVFRWEKWRYTGHATAILFVNNQFIRHWRHCEIQNEKHNHRNRKNSYFECHERLIGIVTLLVDCVQKVRGGGRVLGNTTFRFQFARSKRQMGRQWQHLTRRTSIQAGRWVQKVCQLQICNKGDRWNVMAEASCGVTVHTNHALVEFC